MVQCPVCQTRMAHAFEAQVLHKYTVQYWHCTGCGLLQSETPYWLDEAYGAAIAVADTGLVQRNIALAFKTAALLYGAFDARAPYVDVAGGYGMLVRLLRDFGFDFYWRDKYCQNQLARGFEASAAPGPIHALTAFEVLEHVPDPLAFVSEALQQHGTRTLIFTTQLFDGAPPAPDWWYYAFGTGQHISFYQRRTLACMAQRLGLRLYSAHGVHILTDRALNATTLHWLTGPLAAPLALVARWRLGSRTQSDHERMLAAQAPAVRSE